ncbi:MAG: CRISPR-associated endonuclease Cas2 [Candidatus Sungbacteria bacterium RIFCSPLOWO2_01_FULL_47_32]|uniref:CRISPR-associated endonuclease Cas2 n=1 Tax=Candidatus Sungbacteria bacterium RIFCSPHIGHO2_01_FULL_47_32 TaxID=1802264 RepID=A0A1G2K5Q4_9BACT|nr:MAG: CRISPR-associated endonuclease Cas2 [Candidatus Sungbacteria bacterium RIFCSPHIGHO2_01_FULL_47_32]OGZ99664.1 MAG: CRISPR-associated endonuclease Cas2 [Candidatus Sungbacteria bacterium RIFCSPHIGHO2_02_FULL_46_12]OHA05708.1 MAG: CRISPR-associated endonuclease Cas2 [Candidatus Sungbacteria bacterium RIFCSPLOWO2_01_FULL_47_32]
MKLRHLILKKIAELGEAALDGFFPVKYPQARVWHTLLNTRDNRKFSRRSFSAILSKLNKEGFVERTGRTRNAIWRITQKGRKAIQKQESPAGTHTDGVMRIVSYDIPEPERKKRRWIRQELLGLGYTQLQKSVWVGFAPLREDFFEDLDLLALRKHIHIFSVEKRGTLAETK